MFKKCFIKSCVKKARLKIKARTIPRNKKNDDTIIHTLKK